MQRRGGAGASVAGRVGREEQLVPGSIFPGVGGILCGGAGAVRAAEPCPGLIPYKLGQERLSGKS